MATPSITVRLRGPFFSTNIPPVIVGALDAAIADGAAEGEGDIKIMANPRPRGVFHSAVYAQAHGYRQTGRYHRGVIGEMVRSLHGRVHDSNAIYGPWLESGGGRFKGYAMFRKATQQLGRKMRGFLNDRVQQALARIR
ncbi:hypothetical protein LCGC14_2412840 [marine sediment metagenome]|uniref:Uncharacterized protein n=1 Tax=marine sediment metagenome TaxID=412755 RepID=A0A0F9BS05_9ZZZZ